jgi:hypothetical protein
MIYSSIIIVYIYDIVQFSVASYSHGNWSCYANKPTMQN